MSSSLQWQAGQGEWRFAENRAELKSNGGQAYALTPLTDYVFSARITPGSCEEPQPGIIFRSDATGANRYNFRARTTGIFMLEKIAAGGRAEMAGRVRVPVEESYTLTVIATGWRIRCFVDGRQVYDVTDGAPLSGQHVGLLSTMGDAHFEETAIGPVTGENLGDHLQALARQGVARREREYGFRTHVIDLKGRSGYLSIGDLDGDGKMDFVATQGSKYMTGVTQRGEVLWSYENPGGHIRAHPECQMPTTIYDIDGDGANEVVCRWFREDGHQMIYILDGRTGSIKRELVWEHPMWPEPGESEVGHVIIANLRGLERPRDIIVPTAHWGIFALTDELKPLWRVDREEFARRSLPWQGHHPAVDDLDDDGCEEVCTGGMLLDHDGKILWTKDLWAETGDSHVDSVMIGDVDGDPSNGKEIAFSTGGCLLNAKGEYYWKHRELVLHGQCVRLGKARMDVPGLQVAVVECGRAGGVYLFSAAGEVLLKLPAGMVDFADWNGDGIDEIACGPTVFDGHGQVLAELPVAEVHTAHGLRAGAAHFITADVMGDGRDEVIWTSGDLIVIFENAAPNQNPPRKFTPAEQRARWKRIYNTTRY